MATAPVTAIIPAFNAAATLARALDSVAAQTLRPAQTLVVDDGSADATAAIAQAHPLGVELIRHGANQGSPAALATALGAAAHDIIAFLDADDEWLPAKLAAQMAALGPQTALVATGFVFVDAAGREAWSWGPQPAARAGADFWKALLEHSQIAKPTVLTRASLIAQVGGLDPALRVAEDQDLWIRLALAGPVAYLPQVLARVHDAPASLMKRHQASDITHVLPLVERYLAQLAPRLSAVEVRRIRRRRYAAAAVNLVDKGFYREAWRALRVAMANGEPLAPHLAHMLSKLPRRWRRGAAARP